MKSYFGKQSKINLNACNLLSEELKYSIQNHPDIMINVIDIIHRDAHDFFGEKYKRDRTIIEISLGKNYYTLEVE